MATSPAGAGEPPGTLAVMHLRGLTMHVRFHHGIAYRHASMME
jgi:hypothetical protein